MNNLAGCTMSYGWLSLEEAVKIGRTGWLGGRHLNYGLGLGRLCNGRHHDMPWCRMRRVRFVIDRSRRRRGE